jgi:probable rRNA maturation factor
MNIVIANRQRTKKINTRLLKKITEALLADLEITEAELGINLVAAREMALINETFLRHKGTTDVITFDYAAPEKRKQMHGEIFLCVDDAIGQAEKFKTTWRSEIVRYIVHGILHLQGFDDSRATARRKMKREENRLLRALSKKFSLAQIAGRSKISA